MNWRNPSLHILGLSKKEADILNDLSIARSLQEVAGISAYSRTSIAYCLKGLLKRGFVEKNKFGKRYKFQALPYEQLDVRLKNASGHIKKSDADDLMPVSGQTKKISYYRGLYTVIEVQREFLASHIDERVMAIQSNKSWITLHKKVKPEYVIRLNKIIRENRLILEGILEQDAYEVFNTTHSKMPHFSELAKSFGGRMADYAFAPKGFLTEQVEMWIIKNTVLFINWHDETAIKIVDHDIAYFLKDMFKLSKEDRAKVDHNLAIRKLLK